MYKQLFEKKEAALSLSRPEARVFISSGVKSSTGHNKPNRLGADSEVSVELTP